MGHEYNLTTQIPTFAWKKKHAVYLQDSTKNNHLRQKKIIIVINNFVDVLRDFNSDFCLRFFASSRMNYIFLIMLVYIIIQWKKKLCTKVEYVVTKIGQLCWKYTKNIGRNFNWKGLCWLLYCTEKYQNSIGHIRKYKNSSL